MKLKNNYISYINSNPKEKITNGNETETGILKYFDSIEDINEIRKKFPIHSLLNDDEKFIDICIPFNSENKFSFYLRYSLEYCQFFIAMKGALEVILKKCKRFMFQGKEFDIDDSFIKDLHNANKFLASRGERVICLAYKKLDSNEYPKSFKFLLKKKDGLLVNSNLPLNDLCFVGIISIEDPPRYLFEYL